MRHLSILLIVNNNFKRATPFIPSISSMKRYRITDDPIILLTKLHSFLLLTDQRERTSSMKIPTHIKNWVELLRGASLGIYFTRCFLCKHFHVVLEACVLFQEVQQKRNRPCCPVREYILTMEITISHTHAQTQ